jgi:hypothetical protein
VFKFFVANKLAIALTSLIAAGLVGGALYVKSTQPKVEPGQEFRPKAEENQETPPSTNPPAPSPSSSSPVPPASQTSNIKVEMPKNGEKLTAGSIVKGTAQVFEGRLAYRVKSNRKGQLILGTTSVSGDSSQMSPFSFEIAYEKEPDAGDSGVLEVFSYSPKDGSEINKVVISVTF